VRVRRSKADPSKTILPEQSEHKAAYYEWPIVWLVKGWQREELFGRLRSTLTVGVGIDLLTSQVPIEDDTLLPIRLLFKVSPILEWKRNYIILGRSAKS
jgi:hypothetical protein